MLDPWIIEKIRQREEVEQGSKRPTLELPLADIPADELPAQGEAESNSERGVVIIGI